MPKRFTRYLLILTTVILAVLVVNGVSILRYSHVVQARHADCAIIAGAGINNGLPSLVFQERLNHGISLYQQGLIHTLILTGGISPGERFSDAAIAKRWLIEKGVPEPVILMEERSHVTRENIRYAKSLMTVHHLQNALIVSDPLHMRRLMRIVEDNAITAWSSPTPTSRYQSFKTKAIFLLSETLWYSGYQFLRLLPSSI